VKLDPDKVSCKLDGLFVFRNGAPTDFSVKEASKIISQRQFVITVDLGAAAQRLLLRLRPQRRVRPNKRGLSHVRTKAAVPISSRILRK
jgi:hypothetical protein